MEFEVYCDESRQELFRTRDERQGKFVLLGSIWIEADQRARFKEALHALRDHHNVKGEFKWNKVSPSRLAFYQELVEYFFQENMRFRCFVAEAHELDAARFHQADNELMFYKFYYQLLHHWILDCNRYRIFLDMKTNRVHSRLRVLRDVLSNANLTSEIVDVQALPSREVDLLQLTDVLLGAVGYRFHGSEGSRAKQAVPRARQSLPCSRRGEGIRGTEDRSLRHCVRRQEHFCLG